MKGEYRLHIDQQSGVFSAGRPLGENSIQTAQLSLTLPGSSVYKSTSLSDPNCIYVTGGGET